MIKKVFIFILGYFMTVIGFTFIISYINLTTMGYSIFEYFKYIFLRLECNMAFIGIVLILISIYKKGDKINDIHL